MILDHFFQKYKTCVVRDTMIKSLTQPVKMIFFFNLHFTCYHSFKIIFLLNNFPKIKFFNYFITSYNDHMNFALKLCLICLSTLCAYNVSIKQVQRMITLISYCGEWKYID